MTKYMVEINKEENDVNITTTDIARVIRENFKDVDYKISKVEDIGELDDGYHSFNELYYHRMMLFSVICNTYKDRAWKSLKHDDGTMYENYFIVGIETDEGQYTYHYHIKHWDMFKVKEIPLAPEWDGHQPFDITRLLTLLEAKKDSFTIDVKLTETEKVKDIVMSFIYMLEDSRIDKSIREQYLNSCRSLKEDYFVNLNR